MSESGCLHSARRRIGRRAVCLLITAALVLPAAGTRRAAALSAHAAVLYEPESGQVLFEKDAHEPRSMASTTKIMTALIALETGDLDRELTVEAAAVQVEGSALGLRGGDRITMRDLVTGMMLVSGNDAANAIAYAVSGGLPEFAVRMNERAAAIGMHNSHFVTPSGLDAEGHQSTAYDMALLAAEAMDNPDFAAIAGMQSASIRFGNPGRSVQVSNHNKLLRLYEPAVGIKTGFTKKSGRCLVSAAEKDGVRLIAVTLNAGDDWNDHMALYEQGWGRVRRLELEAPELPPLKVAGGVQGTVPLVTDAPPAKVVTGEEATALHVRIELPAFVCAPVAAGDAVGTVTYSVNSRVLYTGEIRTAAPVYARPVAGFGGRFLEWCGIMLRSLLM